MGRGARLLPLLAGLAAGVLLYQNTAAWRGADLSHLRSPRRYWEDLTVASTSYLSRGLGLPPDSIGSSDGVEKRHAYERRVPGLLGGFAAGEFWRTIPIKPFLATPPLIGRPTDDPGRAMLSLFGFELAGGVAPLLPLWLGAVFSAPVLFWVAWELQRAGRPLTAVLVPVGYASSGYVVETLSLPYSAVGFYLIGLLALTALAVHSVLGPAGAWPPFLARVLLAGSVFAVGVLCRSGTLFLLPGFLLAIALGRIRAPRSESLWRRSLIVTLAACLFVVPYALCAKPRHHEVWLGVWEGLGDFDQSKGHRWHDGFTKKFLRAHGRPAPTRDAVWARDNEAFFREQVTRDVLSDPAWYGGILVQRLWATLSQSYVRSHSQPQGTSVISDYYGMTSTLEWFGVGRTRGRVPVALLAMPVLALIAGNVASWRLARLARIRARLGASLLLLLCVAVGALGLPVLITTASGLETEAFLLVYLLACGLAIDEARLAVREARVGVMEAQRRAHG